MARTLQTWPPPAGESHRDLLGQKCKAPLERWKDRWASCRKCGRLWTNPDGPADGKEPGISHLTHRNRWRAKGDYCPGPCQLCKSAARYILQGDRRKADLILNMEPGDTISSLLAAKAEANGQDLTAGTVARAAKVLRQPGYSIRPLVIEVGGRIRENPGESGGKRAKPVGSGGKSHQGG